LHVRRDGSNHRRFLESNRGIVLSRHLCTRPNLIDYYPPTHVIDGTPTKPSGTEENRARRTTPTTSAAKEHGLIGRRSALKLIGVVTVPLAAQSVHAESTRGYGDAGYGTGPYGGESERDDEERGGVPPTVGPFDADEERPPN